MGAPLRSLAQMFPRFFMTASTKHNHYEDFGWPENLQFDDFYRMWKRNSLAKAGVSRTIDKTWETNPELWESEEPAESKLEKEIVETFGRLRVWQQFAQADMKAMVGGYAGVVLRFRDGQPLDQPVRRAMGLQGLAGVVSAWAVQLVVSEWHTDPSKEEYGTPKMFAFRESALVDNSTAAAKPARDISVHPDRVLIWSEDGTVNCVSDLESGFNDLLDAEKIKGASGEGFWKNAKSSPVLKAAPDLKIDALAKAMGVAPAQVADAMNEQVTKWQSGFDSMLMVQGMEADTLSVTLPSPEHFFAGPVQSFAASLSIPVKILLGSQTGERASTEDAREWAQSCMARRNTRCLPLVKAFVERLVKFGVLPPREWHYGWQDLTEATATEKLDRATKMASINQTTGMGVFEPNEIREAAGYEEIDFPDEAQEFNDPDNPEGNPKPPVEDEE